MPQIYIATRPTRSRYTSATPTRVNCALSILHMAHLSLVIWGILRLKVTVVTLSRSCVYMDATSILSSLTWATHTSPGLWSRLWDALIKLIAWLFAIWILNAVRRKEKEYKNAKSVYRYIDIFNRMLIISLKKKHTSHFKYDCLRICFWWDWYIAIGRFRLIPSMAIIQVCPALKWNCILILYFSQKKLGKWNVIIYLYHYVIKDCEVNFWISSCFILIWP